MSWCAGFGESFYNAYFKVLFLFSQFLYQLKSSLKVVLFHCSLKVMPKQAGYEKRRDLYLLYHYLNHYNLFGSGYRSSAMSIIDDYLRMLKA